MLLMPFPATAPRGELCWLSGDYFVAIHFTPEATIRLNSRFSYDVKKCKIDDFYLL